MALIPFFWKLTDPRGVRDAMTNLISPRSILVSLAVILAVGPAAQPDEPQKTQNAGPLARALWLVHRFGTAEAVDPRNDQKTKGTLAKALGKDAVLVSDEAQGPDRSRDLRRARRPRRPPRHP